MNQPPYPPGFQPPNPYQPQQQQYAQQPNQPPSTIFDGMRTATIFKQGNYYLPGIYNVEVIRCLDKATFKGKNGFIAELRTKASNNPAEPVGGEKSWFQDMSSYPQTAWSSVLEFAIAVYGIQVSDLAKIAELQQSIVEIMKQAIGPQNIFAGRMIRLETFMKKTKGKGGDFTVHRWSPYDGTEPPVMSAAAQMQQAPVHQMQQVPVMPPMQQQQQMPVQQGQGQFGAPLPMPGQPPQAQLGFPMPGQQVASPTPPPMEFNAATGTWQFKK